MLKKTKPWDEFEQDVAEAFGGKVVRGSGRADQHKGDVITPQFLIECKSTQSSTYYVETRLIRKIALEALNRNKDWLFCVRTQDKDWCLMSPMIAPTICDFFPPVTAKKSVPVKADSHEALVTVGGQRKVLLLTLQHAKEILNEPNTD